jgi:hypothetical protein
VIPDETGGAGDENGHGKMPESPDKLPYTGSRELCKPVAVVSPGARD